MISKLLQPPIKLALAIILALTMLGSNSASIKAENNPNNNSDPPPVPNTGTPSGDPTPGTTRPQATCPKTSKPLTALMANNGSDYTLSEYPTFWFYVPYAPDQISYMEFLLLDGKERQTIYQTAVKLTEKPGIIKIKIPSESQYSFKFNEIYHWYFKVNCKSERTNQPELVIDGWVQRQPLNLHLRNQIEVAHPKEYLIHKENAFWYDAIANLAQQHFSHPENLQLHEDWANLLKFLGYEWVIEEPFVNSVLLPSLD
ncbi:DUF928 domain-containing protein [Nostoc sp. CENA67]|uniref:DUF928 domain-containing protein n=1 Tax=Amazonocrinis nigriterrae CENA67 TaxID=2794033 RepID=A0A8J7HNW8_9NOST|nr:DUF928 domain-containing protein [Amazonocrinis nigriterrae]MBH8561615.1 DUF928 domain-containing protein [Amazonocrinis nigriterrae CENA67]